jgi:thermitase
MEENAMGTSMFRGALVGAALLISVATQAAESVPGEYVVQLKRSRAPYSAAQLSRVLKANVIEMIRKDMALVEKDLSANPRAIVAELNANPLVEFAEPNYIYKLNKTPNDTDYTKLWGMNNTGEKDSAGNAGVSGMDINAEKAWEVTTGSKNVVVAVIDTGIHTSHPDLKNNVWVNEQEAVGKAGVDDDANGYVDDVNGYNFVAKNGALIDDHGHGTHCAGTIGAEANNGVGVAGVAWNVRMMGVKFLSKDGSGSLDDAVKAIDYARVAGAHIMSNSWGGGSFSLALEKAIKDARDAGILFVAAAGNSSNDNDATPAYPSTYQVDNVVSVAALDNRGQLASFSSYGANTVHVAAPGVNIWSTVPTGYKGMSGTSMATPHVSGVAALLLSKESLTPLEVRTRLIETSKPLFGLRGVVASSGIVDAYAALTNQKPPPDPNDPTNWAGTQQTEVSTPHPYVKNTSYTYDIDVPGAKQIVLHFKKFESEPGYDTLKVMDENGKEIGKISGNQTNRLSPVYNTSKVRLKFDADSSLDMYGFDIDYVKYQ